MSILEVQDTIITGLYHGTNTDGQWELLGACPLCHSYDRCGEVISVEYGPRLAVCQDCHFGFLYQRPTEEWINSFYATQWDQSGPPTAVTPNPRAFNHCKELVANNSRILDVGAGYGGMLLPFKDHGCSIAAIEASQQRATFLEALGIEIAAPSIAEAPAGAYDLAIMHHSLEHVYDPVATIQQLSHALTQSGLVYIAVPDLWQEHPIQAAHYVPHLSLFTMEALLTLLKDNGFAPLVVNSGYDLEILAVKNDGDWGINMDYDFDATINQWVQAPIGDIDGQITSVWSTGALGKMRYPKWLSHEYVHKPYEMLPIGDQGMVRVVWGILSQDERPLIICHPDGNPTVWIK